MRRTGKSPSKTTGELRISGLGAAVEVRRHPKARRMTLRVSRTSRTVIVTLPMQCDLDQAGSFVNNHLDWVRRHLGSLPQPVPFRHGAVVPLRGVPHRIVHSPRHSGRGVVTVSHGGSIPELLVRGEVEHLPRRVLDWMSEQARRDLDRAVQRHAERLGVKAKRIAVRDQVSRWGSCSSNGSLSFSWRLILAPDFILDYVAAHEVAHLQQMNHGPRFWALVRKTMPRTEEARRWLQIYGLDLHRYGAD